MSERKPRTIDVRVRKCPNCGRLSDGRYTGGLCGCDDASESEFERIVFVEVLGPERMLAWAIDRKGEEWCAHAVAQALCHAKHGDRRYDPGKRSHRRKWLRKGRVAVRALWGSGDGE